jgi:prevent-host-death family protein
MDVGVRELKNNLSRFLSLVSGGQEVLVTDRGKPVARLVPVAGQRTLDHLIAEGLVSRAKSPKRNATPSRVKATEPVSPLVAEQRR